jgi:8-amino-7-oxononanoate synthase
LENLCERNDACLMVDDAHGLGVLGAEGAGSLQHFGLSHKQVPILMATLGKGLGTAGAFIAGSEELIEGLIQLARSYIYTTAIPPAVAAATLTSLKIIKREPERRQQLATLINRFRAGASQLGLPLMPSQTAIQPLMIGAAENAMLISQSLAASGILVSAIRPPTVPAETARLRITLTASHTSAQVDQLLDVLRQVIA